MLLAVTPNPAIDRTLVVPGFRHAEVTRVTQRHDAAGGKGLNVVRVGRSIGLPVRACAPLGGETGRTITELAAAEGLDGRWSWIAAGESRICLLITDLETQDTLVVNEQGPTMTPEDWGAFAGLILDESAAMEAVSFSGSLMPGAPVEGFRTLLEALLAAGRTVFVDTSGQPLRAMLDLPVALLKINAHELSDALDRPILGIDDALDGARMVQARGPKAVIVTLGKEGAIAVDRNGAWAAHTQPIRLVSPVGSGDAVLTGAVDALLRGADLGEAVRAGVACGAANALTLGAGVVRSGDLQRLLAGSELRRYDR